MTKAPVASPPVTAANPGPRSAAGLLPPGPPAVPATTPQILSLSGSQRLRFSWLALAAGALVGFLIARQAVETSQTTGEAAHLLVVGPLSMAYIGWSLFWGAPASWQWFWSHRSIFAGLRKVKHFGPLYYLACSLAWVVWGVLVFSMLGGGIYHFLRYRRSLP